MAQAPVPAAAPQGGQQHGGGQHQAPAAAQAPAAPAAPARNPGRGIGVVIIGIAILLFVGSYLNSWTSSPTTPATPTTATPTPGAPARDCSVFPGCPSTTASPTPSAPQIVAPPRPNIVELDPACTGQMVDQVMNPGTTIVNKTCAFRNIVVVGKVRVLFETCTFQGGVLGACRRGDDQTRTRNWLVIAAGDEHKLTRGGIIQVTPQPGEWGKIAFSTFK